MTLLVLPARIATHVVMMIAMKNNIIKIATGVTMIANAGIMKARGIEDCTATSP